MNSHCLALSSLITLFFFLTILPPSYSNAVEYFVECSRPLDCGWIKNIPYPFWGGNRPETCGIQGFELTCRDNEYPIISFEELQFLVLNISQSHHIMTIARLDLWKSPCLPKVDNTSLDFNNFDYITPADLNQTLFYNCTSRVRGLDGAYFSCPLGGVGATGNTANYLVDEFSPKIPELLKECNTSIRVPILRTALIGAVGGSLALTKVLNQGFDVDYLNALSIPCWGCVALGGICSSPSSPEPFVCFCRDGEHPSVCLSNGMHARFSSHFWIRLKHIFLVLCSVFGRKKSCYHYFRSLVFPFFEFYDIYLKQK